MNEAPASLLKKIRDAEDDNLRTGRTRQHDDFCYQDIRAAVTTIPATGGDDTGVPMPPKEHGRSKARRPGRTAIDHPSAAAPTATRSMGLVDERAMSMWKEKLRITRWLSIYLSSARCRDGQPRGIPLEHHFRHDEIELARFERLMLTVATRNKPAANAVVDVVLPAEGTGRSTTVSPSLARGSR